MTPEKLTSLRQTGRTTQSMLEAVLLARYKPVYFLIWKGHDAKWFVEDFESIFNVTKVSTSSLRHPSGHNIVVQSFTSTPPLGFIKEFGLVFDHVVLEYYGLFDHNVKHWLECYEASKNR